MQIGMMQSSRKIQLLYLINIGGVIISGSVVEFYSTLGLRGSEINS